jgi:hypothetical protein
LLEEIVTETEKEVEKESFNRELVLEKKVEILYDYYCWNLKLISTKEFYENLQRYEEIIYETGVIKGKKKITDKIKILLDIKKPEEFFEELNPKFSIFKDKRKRQMYKGEEIHDADDEIYGNPINMSPEKNLVKEESQRKEKEG